MSLLLCLAMTQHGTLGIVILNLPTLSLTLPFPTALSKPYPFYFSHYFRFYSQSILHITVKGDIDKGQSFLVFPSLEVLEKISCSTKNKVLFS